MSDVESDPFGFGAPLTHGGDHVERLVRAQELALGAVPYVGLLIGIFGCGLLWMLLAPDRQRRGVDRLRQAPIASFALGAVLWIIPAFLLVVLVTKFGVTRVRGQTLLALWVFFSGCAGLAVCARALGERVLSDRGPIAQTVLGLTALVLPLFTLIGLPVFLIAAPLGVGAWVTARRKQITITSDKTPPVTTSE